LSSSESAIFRNVHPLGPDPVLCDFPMPLQAVFYPLGFPIEISTNSADVIMAAEESWELWPPLFNAPPVALRIGVLDGESSQCANMPVCRGQQNLLSMFSDPHNFGVLDLSSGFGFGWFTAATVRYKAFFRYHFLEGMAMTLLMAQHLAPVHAACVSWNGTGILLCGDSGAGKSSLSYACAQRDWTFITDDSSAVVRSRHDRLVVGNSHRMRFRESAIDLFPELLKEKITARITGEMAIELATQAQPEMVTAPNATVDHLVFLNRGTDTSPRLSQFPADQALRWLEQMIVYGDTRLRESQKAALHNLLAADVHELRYSDLDAAVARLVELAENGE
jgi:HPr Serine kinase C-terminal domain